MTGATPHPDERPPIAHGPLRWLLLAAGWLFVGLGVLGAVLPVLPTTPFLLLAAACFARSSERFYAWLLDNRVFGPLIRDWRAHRAMPRHAKRVAIAAIVVFIGSSTVLFVAHPWGRVAMVATGVALVAFLLRIPSREDVARDDPAPKADF
ncbi:MAG TPA: YbaN family protein [Myxococcota bacterium]|nr:YbaN family protein [Myxococcota bacterium]